MPFAKGQMYPRLEQSGCVSEMRQGWTAVRVHTPTKAQATEENGYKSGGAGERDEVDAGVVEDTG